MSIHRCLYCFCLDTLPLDVQAAEAYVTTQQRAIKKIDEGGDVQVGFRVAQPLSPSPTAGSHFSRPLSRQQSMRVGRRPAGALPGDSSLSNVVLEEVQNGLPASFSSISVSTCFWFLPSCVGCWCCYICPLLPVPTQAPILPLDVRPYRYSRGQGAPATSLKMRPREVEAPSPSANPATAPTAGTCPSLMPPVLIQHGAVTPTDITSRSFTSGGLGPPTPAHQPLEGRRGSSGGLVSPISLQGSLGGASGVDPLAAFTTTQQSYFLYDAGGHGWNNIAYADVTKSFNVDAQPQALPFQPMEVESDDEGDDVVCFFALSFHFDCCSFCLGAGGL